MHPNGQHRVCENAVILLDKIRFYFLSAKFLQKLPKRDEKFKNVQNEKFDFRE